MAEKSVLSWLFGGDDAPITTQNVDMNEVREDLADDTDSSILTKNPALYCAEMFARAAYAEAKKGISTLPSLTTPDGVHGDPLGVRVLFDNCVKAVKYMQQQAAGIKAPPVLVPVTP